MSGSSSKKQQVNQSSSLETEVYKKRVTLCENSKKKKQKNNENDQGRNRNDKNIAVDDMKSQQSMTHGLPSKTIPATSITNLRDNSGDFDNDINNLDLESSIKYQIACCDKHKTGDDCGVDEDEVLYLSNLQAHQLRSDNKNAVDAITKIQIKFRLCLLNDVPTVAKFFEKAWPKLAINQAEFECNQKEATDGDLCHNEEKNSEEITSIENVLKNALGSCNGDENIVSIPACQIMICDVKPVVRISSELETLHKSEDAGNICNSSDNKEWTLAGLAIISISWEAQAMARILKVNLFYVDQKWKMFGLDERFVLRLSALALSSGCSGLRIRKPSTKFCKQTIDNEVPHD